MVQLGLGHLRIFAHIFLSCW